MVDWGTPALISWRELPRNNVIFGRLFLCKYSSILFYCDLSTAVFLSICLQFLYCEILEILVLQCLCRNFLHHCSVYVDMLKLQFQLSSLCPSCQWVRQRLIQRNCDRVICLVWTSEEFVGRSADFLSIFEASNEPRSPHYGLCISKLSSCVATLALPFRESIVRHWILISFRCPPKYASGLTLLVVCQITPWACLKDILKYQGH